MAILIIGDVGDLDIGVVGDKEHGVVRRNYYIHSRKITIDRDTSCPHFPEIEGKGDVGGG